MHEPIPGTGSARVAALSRLVLTGGLSGGHVTPCLTVGLHFQGRGADVMYLGATGQLEQELARQYRLPFSGFRFDRQHRVRRWLLLAAAIPVCLWRLSRFRPDVVFSKGSIVSVPVVLAARLLRIPVVLHESDVVPGPENRVLARYASHVCAGSTACARQLPRPAVVTGNLTRPNFAGGSAAACHQRFGTDPGRPLLLIIGGSQGASTLNELVRAILPRLRLRYSVIHQVGRGKRLPIRSSRDYVQVEFLGDELADVYAASDLVVSRAGATAVAEATYYRVPAVYVPYPWAVHDHQRANAELAAAGGSAVVEPQPGLTPEQLLATVDRVMEQRQVMRGCYPPRGADPLTSVAAVLRLAGTRHLVSHD